VVPVTADPGLPPSRPHWRDTLRFLADIARAQPLAFVALVALVTIGNLPVAIHLAAQGGIVDAIIDRDSRQAFLWVLAYVGATFVEEIYWGIKPWLVAIVRDRAVHLFQHRVLQRAGRVPLIAFEHGSFSARLQRANDDLGGKLAGLLNSLVDSFQILVSGAAVIGTLWFISPWLLLIVLPATIPAVFLELRVASAVQEVERRHARGNVFLGKLEAIIRDRDAAAELRLFGNGPDLVNRWAATRTARVDDTIAADRRQMRFRTGSETIRGLAFSVAVAFALWTISGERLSIGTWVIATTGLEWLSWFARWVVMVLRDTREQAAYAGDLFDFEEQADRFIADERRSRHANPSTAVPSSGPVGIEVDSVSFGYPGSEQPVLHDISLSIPAGQTVALVGENGAGKSTLARLLTGLYLPDAGTVTLDGIDTRSDGMDLVTPRIAAVFQEYLALQLSLREVIGFGAVDRERDQESLDLAARQANLAHLVATLPEGYDTWLGREFGERDLSGGQWQRTALARAFYRDADLVILDEPTAALDPLAELDLFERFAELVHDRTAIMVSHRLGMARFADRILVLDEGVLVEDGHHDELMAANGTYARMFAAQAEWYQGAQPSSSV